MNRKKVTRIKGKWDLTGQRMWNKDNFFPNKGRAEMSIKIKIPLSYVQNFADDTDFVQLTPELIDVKGGTVGECIHHLIGQFPFIKNQLFKETGRLFENVLISVNGKSAYPEALAKPVKDGDEINIVFMVSGG
jgi:MoaD family protein